MTSMKSVLLFHNILESMDSKERAWQEEEEICFPVYILFILMWDAADCAFPSEFHEHGCP